MYWSSLSSDFASMLFATPLDLIINLQRRELETAISSRRKTTPERKPLTPPDLFFPARAVALVPYPRPTGPVTMS